MPPARQIVAALLALTAAAPAAAATEDAQLWLNGTVIGTVPGSNVAYFAEVSPRFSRDTGRLSALLLRPAIGWRASPAFTGYLGYARVVTERVGRPNGTEDRLFLQASWTLGDVAGGTLSSRTRLERRDVKGGDDIGWRVREFIRWSRPLGDAKTPRALLWAEPFVALNDTDWGARGGFDQLRAFAGLEIPVGGRSTLEAGYLNQSINDPGGRRRMNHVASLTLWLRP